MRRHCHWFLMEHQGELITPRYCCSSTGLLVFRSIGAVFLLQLLIHTMAYADYWYEIFAFLTMWGVIFTLITFTSLLFLQCKPEMSCCEHFSHFIYTLALTFGGLIFVIFWAVLVPVLIIDNDAAHSTPPTLIVLAVQQHVITQALILLDFVFSESLFHKPHIILIFTVGIAYLVVNCIVSLQIFVVYPILTWRDGYTAMWLVVCVALIVVFFWLFYTLGNKKRSTHRRLEDKSSKLSEQEDDGEQP